MKTVVIIITGWGVCVCVGGGWGGGGVEGIKSHKYERNRIKILETKIKKRKFE